METQAKKEFIMRPKIDFAFKELMENETVRIGFLSAILKIKPDDIQTTVLLNTNLRKEHAEDKQGILDVRIRLNNNAEINIEIQLSYLEAWPERSLFYLSKLFSNQLGEGEEYAKTEKCISISILDFNLLKDTKEFYSCFHFREDKRLTVFTDKMELHILELPKLPEQLVINDDIFLWAKFINAENKEDFEMIAEKNAYIKEAYNQLEIISQDKLKRFEYESRQKTILDNYCLQKQSMREGWKKGMEEGMEKGMEKGMEETAKKIAGRLLHLGISVEEIAKTTELTIAEIESLK